VLEQAIALGDGESVGADDLPAAVRANLESRALAAGPVPTLRDIERAHIFSVLDRVDGNRAQAARLLGMSERRFYRLLRKHRLTSMPLKSHP